MKKDGAIAGVMVGVEFLKNEWNQLDISTDDPISSRFWEKLTFHPQMHFNV